MLGRIEDDIANHLEYLTKRHPSVPAKHIDDGRNAVANQRLELGWTAVEQHCADSDLILSRMSVKQYIQGCEQRHVRRDAVCFGEHRHAIAQLRRNRYRDRRSFCRYRRSWD